MASIAASTRKAGRPSAMEATRIHEMILDAAIDAFITHGFADATIDGIALRAQTTRRSIVHRFPLKEDLLNAALERKFRIMSGQIAIREDNSKDVLEIMRSAFRRLLDYFLDPANLGYSRLIMHEARTANVGLQSIQWNDAIVASYTRLILRAQEMGSFRRYSANTVAHMVIGVMLSNPLNRALLGDPAFSDPDKIDLYFSEMWAVFLSMA